jgi:sorbitol-6-phosphate 2-dehydrogenase
MVKQHDGVIVNVSSESGLEGSEGQSCYAATKAALNSFTRSWSKELGKHGIRVVGIAPGILEKPGYARRSTKKRWPGRAISLWNSCVTAIQRTRFRLDARVAYPKLLILFVISCLSVPATLPE